MRFAFKSAAAACARRALTTATTSGGGGGGAKPGWSRNKWILAAGTALVTAGGGAWAWEREEAHGVRRSARFWVQVFPIFLHYKWTQHVTCMDFSLNGRTPIDEAVADKHWNCLHQKYAARVHGIMTDMGGFYFKTGQLLSTRDDFVPPEYLSFFKQLQDAAPPRPFEHVKSVIERELGREMRAVFKEFEETACGAASIGQVHRAVLRNGLEVAVKVMYPGVEQMFRSDLKTVKDFCSLAMPQHLPALDEIERQFVTEFDYRKEGANLNEVANNLSGIWDHVAVVPHAHLHMCTKSVLVMDYLPGVKLVSAIRAQFSRFAAAQGKTMEQLEAELKATQGSLKPPGKRTVQLYAFWLKISDGAKNVSIRMRNWLGAWWGLKPLPLVHTEVPINLFHIIDVMLKASTRLKKQPAAL
jgi:aarF domain-containing kinase